MIRARVAQFTAGLLLGAPYTIPSEGNRFTPPLLGLPGIPVDGAGHVPDVAGHPIRAQSPEQFVAPVVPLRRFVAQATPSGWRSVDSLAGGVSENLGGNFEQNLLRSWLTNETYPIRWSGQDLVGATDSVTLFIPGRRP